MFLTDPRQVLLVAWMHVRLVLSGADEDRRSTVYRPSGPNGPREEFLSGSASLVHLDRQHE